MTMAPPSYVKRLRSLVPGALVAAVCPGIRRLERFARSLAASLPQGSAVLDAGAGQCQYKKYFSSHRYVAMDAACGDKLWNYSNLDAVCDLARLPCRDETYAGVLLTQVLEHVSEPQAVLDELYRILRPGGLLYLSVPQSQGEHQPPHDYFRYTRYGLSHLLEKAGFTVMDIHPECGFFEYLGNRMTVVPKILFWQRRRRACRIALLPLELLSYVVFVGFCAPLLNALDRLDTRRDFTLNYFATATKVTPGNASDDRA